MFLNRINKNFGSWIQGFLANFASRDSAVGENQRQLFWTLLLWVAVMVSLLSFDRNDPSFNHATLMASNNVFGRLGSYASDLVLQLFGAAAYVFVGIKICHNLILLLGSSALRNQTYRLASYFMLPLIAVFMALFVPPEQWLVPSLGGFVGQSLLNIIISIPFGWVLYGILLLASMVLMFDTNLLHEQSQLIKDYRRQLRSIESKIERNLTKKFMKQQMALTKAQRNKKVAPTVLAKSVVNEEAVAETPVIADGIFKMPKSSKPISTAHIANKNPEIKATSDDYQSPSLDLLKAPKDSGVSVNKQELMLKMQLLSQVLADFGVKGNISEVSPGPVVTLYNLEPAAGTKSSRVIGLADDIARSMEAISARIATVPGKNIIGIELPNPKREMVLLREILDSPHFQHGNQSLPLALGKDIGGEPVIADLAKMPHLLVAGTTGSGKSVGVNAMILSLLYQLSPEQCKFIMIDPKMLELSIYQDIPHLMCPVVTEPGKAVSALKWVVREMENRYRLMSHLNVRNVDGYNQRIAEAIASGQELTREVQTSFDPETGRPIYEEVPVELTKMPYIVVVVDEMADLMLVAGKDIESSIQRLAQMARAAGIHLIMATQRPSVDVITGVIKANFPTRISFQVTSKIDSRTILGEQGAEQLLGMGDMLYMMSGSRITRVHGAFVGDREVEAIVKHLKRQGVPNYVDNIATEDALADSNAGGSFEGGDELFNQAVEIIKRDGKASTSFIQRSLRIGYNRAANIIEEMERQGLVSAANHVGKREVLIK